MLDELASSATSSVSSFDGCRLFWFWNLKLNRREMGSYTTGRGRIATGNSIPKKGGGDGKGRDETGTAWTSFTMLSIPPNPKLLLPHKIKAGHTSRAILLLKFFFWPKTPLFLNNNLHLVLPFQNLTIQTEAWPGTRKSTTHRHLQVLACWYCNRS